MKKTNLIISLFVLLTFPMHAFAHDTDLYTSSGAGVEPNILIIFDNSGSMNDQVQAYFYDNTVTYSPQTYTPGAVYYRTFGGWSLFKNSIAEVPCEAARTALTNQGMYQGNTSSGCNSQNRTLRTGNYRNYLASVGGSQYRSKIEITKGVIKNFLDTVNGVRVGVMVFNTSEGGRIQSPITNLSDVTRAQLKSDIDAIVAETWTPLGETLYEAGLYFKGERSFFNSGINYTSPIQYYCQRNYVIIITDGISTQDRNSVLKDGATVAGTVYPKIGDRDGDQREPGMANDVSYDNYGSDYLDDIAKYFYDSDLRSDFTTQQNIITHTIGFELDTSDPAMAPKAKDLLQRTATLGHGRFYTTTGGTQGLAEAFENIISDILAKSTSFVAPIVPVSRLERTTAGDKIYLAFFKPVANGIWNGNIKKFGVQQTEDPASGLHSGDIIDANGNKALDSSGQFYSMTKSFWTLASADGGEVEQGGVGEVLISRLSLRTIHTYFYASVNLTDASNSFQTTNASITPTVLGLLPADTTGRDKVIHYVHGYDPYDDNGNGDFAEKREWILGSFLHSRPAIVHYTGGRSVIYAGANDGMLHAFDDSDGRELWGFVPPNLLNNLPALHADTNASFVDGSPRAYISYEYNPDGSIRTVLKAILIFGERRGGDRYYALDVTDPDSPQFLWEIGPTERVYQTTRVPTTDYQELGQTWSSPIMGKIDDGTTEGKLVVFIGGGFDTNQDNDPVIASDSRGRAVYVVDLLTGTLVKRFSITEYPDMAYSIPSDIARVDTDGNGKVDRLYVGDMGGRMWRFDIGNPDPSQWTATIILKSNSVAGDRRKIFYAPDVTLERDATGDYEAIFFGTGDRETPKEKTVINRFYSVKDRFTVTGGVYTPATPLGETDLLNVTAGNPDLNELSAKSGWYVSFENAGEKSLANPVVFYKIVYFTTFTPSGEIIVGDPCCVGEGTARLYAVKYNTGNAFFNFDLTNDVSGTTVLAKSDRSIMMGTAIPSGVIITFIGGKAVAYAGVGGGVFTPALSSTNPLVPMTWRVVF
ncbi:MAG: pilus assembly protein [Thermodesulfobacteriota bacterium]